MAASHKPSSPSLGASSAGREPFPVAEMLTNPPGVLYTMVKHTQVFILRNVTVLYNEYELNIRGLYLSLIHI